MTDEMASAVNFQENRKQTVDRTENEYYLFIISTSFGGFFRQPFS